MLDQYIGVVLTFALAATVVGLMVSASMLLGPHKRAAMKDQVFECGNPPSGTARGRFSVRFYLGAIIFIVFDVEVVFLYPWAIVLRSLGVPGLVEMTVFIAVLGVALAYVWRKGALVWS
jgi:NADH-quinone oxidoreductase subunit A